MKLRIRHVTRYRYRCAVTLLPHRLMLMQRGTQDLRVLSTSLEVVPAAGGATRGRAMAGKCGAQARVAQVARLMSTTM